MSLPARKSPIERMSESGLLTPVKRFATRWEHMLEAVEHLEIINRLFNIRMESARVFIDIEQGFDGKRVYRIVVQSSINPALYWVKETP